MFGKRTVVHVDTVAGVSPGQHLAKYTIGTIQRAEPFVPGPFLYSLQVKRIVSDDANLTAKQRKRLVVAVHRGPGAREGFRAESKWGLVLALALALVSCATVCAAIHLQQMEEKAAVAVPALLLVSTAVNAATMAGVVFFRALKRSVAIEPTRKWIWREFGTVAILTLTNGAVIIFWPLIYTWLNGFLPAWKFVADAIEVAIAALSLLGSLAGAFANGVKATWGWTLVQELQQQIPEVRPVVDLINHQERA